MAIPAGFRADGCLSEGIHDATWTEFADRFGYNLPRAVLLAQLLDFCRLLKFANAAKLYVDGSFITTKPEPGDVDVCFDPLPIDDTVFTLWTWAAQKRQFPLMDIKPDFGEKYLNLFQMTRQSDARKGIVCLLLDSLPVQER